MFFQGASSEIIQAMLAGDANFAGIAGPAIISNVIGGGDVIQVAALVKTFTIPLYSQPSIKTLNDLKGQKVGVSRFGAVTHITALSVLQSAGIVKDVTIVQTGGISESRRWEELFAGSHDRLADSADQAWAEHRAGQTEKLDPEKL